MSYLNFSLLKKKSFLFLLASGIMFTSISWTNSTSNNYHRDRQKDNEVLLFSKSFNTKDIKNVTVSTTGGSITLAGDATGSASVEVSGQGNNGRKLSKDEILEILKNDYEFLVGVENGTLKAIVKRKVSGARKRAVSISFNIHVGKYTSTDLETSGGNIWLSTLQGTQSFTTSGGNIHFENLSGNINGRTSGGNITALSSKGKIQANTSGGSIDIQDLNGDIVMHTSGGNINAQNVSGALGLTTNGGNLTLSNIAAKVYGGTSGGSVHASLSKLKQEVELFTSGGSINITIPKIAKANFVLDGSRVSVGAANNIQVDMNKQKSFAAGSLNNGGVHLKAHSSGGSVSLDFK